MKIIARLKSENGPVKLSPSTTALNGAQDDHVVAVPMQDAKKFIQDIAALFQSKLVGIQDKLIGAVFSEDRILYCGKRLQWIEKLECRRTIPFAIELVRNGERVWLNQIPVSEVRNIAGKTIYGMAYGDVALDYLFPVVE